MSNWIVQCWILTGLLYYECLLGLLYYECLIGLFNVECLIGLLYYECLLGLLNYECLIGLLNYECLIGLFNSINLISVGLDCSMNVFKTKSKVNNTMRLLILEIKVYMMGSISECLSVKIQMYQWALFGN